MTLKEKFEQKENRESKRVWGKNPRKTIGKIAIKWNNKIIIGIERQVRVLVLSLPSSTGLVNFISSIMKETVKSVGKVY